jgi:hypothetical protein
MVSILSSNLVRWFRDHKGLEQQRVLFHLECQLWQFCLLPTSISMSEKSLTVILGEREYVGGMDGLMKVFVDDEEEIALKI